jgi:two-component system sensor histidine kinase DevS
MPTSDISSSTGTRTDEAVAGGATAASRQDGELRALAALVAVQARFPRPEKPDGALQAVCDLAKELTRGRYSALAITDEKDRTEGFYTSGLTPEALKGLKVPPTGHGPLGSLRSDGKPVRIEDLDQHAAAFGFPPKHPVMKRMLGVPIWANGVVRGSMYVTDRADDAPFDDEDERAMVTLARHASYVVENYWY